MRFCEKCGNLLIVKRGLTTTYLVCRKCGREYKKGEKITITEKVAEDQRKIVVMSKGESESELPTTKIMCPKCENMEAYWWMQQTRAADEPPTLFYRCKKCGYSWRSYG